MAQRYRLTFEFVLKDPSDYIYTRAFLYEVLTKRLTEIVEVLPDHLQVERVNNADD